MTRPSPNSPPRFQLIAIAAGVLAVGVGAVVLFRAADDDAPAARTPPSQRFARPLDPAVEAEVGTLARRGDAAGLVDLYARSGDKGSARARILDALLAGADRRAGMKSALEALARVPGAIADDPLVEYLSEKMLALWKDPMLYKYGRDLMLTQASDKARAVLVTSLTRHTATLTEAQDPERQARSWLTNDLVDLYPQCSEEAKTIVLTAVQEVGGDDVVRAMTGGAAPHEYDTVQHQADEMERAAEALRDQGDQNDPGGTKPPGPDRDEILKQLGKP